MSAKKRLGKGLDSLIPAFTPRRTPTEAPASPAAAVATDDISEIALALLDPNPKQPRTDFGGEDIQTLADSIKKYGVLQPVLVRPVAGRYQIIAGERRVRASKLAGRETVPAVVRELSDDEMLLFALIENVQREDLDPIERAKAFVRLLREMKVSQEEVASYLGMSRTAVTNTIRLLELERAIQEMIAQGSLSAGHGRALLAIKEPKERLMVAKTAVETGMSVRELEKRAYGEAPPDAAPKTSNPAPSAHLTDMEQQLQEVLGTKVTINKKRRGGKIAIHFYDNDDFERIFSLLVSKTMY